MPTVNAVDNHAELPPLIVVGEFGIRIGICRRVIDFYQQRVLFSQKFFYVVFERAEHAPVIA